MVWQRNRFVRRSLNGAASGFLATFPMNLTMLGIRKALPIFHHHSLPPYKISKRIYRKLRLLPPWATKKKKILTNVSHFGYGAAGGVAYSAFANNMEHRKRHVMMAASHIVWGTSIAYIFDRLEKAR